MIFSDSRPHYWIAATRIGSSNGYYWFGHDKKLIYSYFYPGETNNCTSCYNKEEEELGNMAAISGTMCDAHTPTGLFLKNETAINSNFWRCKQGPFLYPVRFKSCFFTYSHSHHMHDALFMFRNCKWWKSVICRSENSRLIITGSIRFNLKSQLANTLRIDCGCVRIQLIQWRHLLWTCDMKLTNEAISV